MKWTRSGGWGLALVALCVGAQAVPGTAVAQPPADAATALLADSDRLMAEVSPEILESLVLTSPADGLRALQFLGQALRVAEELRAPALQSHLAAVARARCRRLLAAGGPWPDEEIDGLLSLMLVDPARFVADADFRPRVLPVVIEGLDPSVPPSERDRVLRRLNHLAGLPFRFSEAVQLGWGRIRRSSQPLRRPFAPESLLPAADATGSISASIFSFPARFFEPEPVAELLRALRRRAPERHLVVLADGAVREALLPLADELGLLLFDTLDRPFTPWVRDVLAMRRDTTGRVVIVLRPETQIGREDDVHMGQVVLQNLPEDLFAAWRPTWQASAIPFHNGQILHTPDAAWISLHSLKAAIRRLTGHREIPNAARTEPAVAAAYFEAARAAVPDLQTLLGKPVRFVHGFGHPAHPTVALAELAGGAPHDLDSLLTLLPTRAGTRALVADPSLGRDLLAQLGAAEIDAFGAAYGLAPTGTALTSRLDAALTDRRGSDLQSFLDAVARHLTAAGLEVERLPLLRVPADALADPRVETDFLVGWHNVTLEARDGALVADGFSAALDRGDALAVAAFARAGYRLELLPPLIESVVRSGGYRCLSNHLRTASPS